MKTVALFVKKILKFIFQFIWFDGCGIAQEKIVLYIIKTAINNAHIKILMRINNIIQ